jgi:hypothetical protein
VILTHIYIHHDLASSFYSLKLIQTSVMVAVGLCCVMFVLILCSLGAPSVAYFAAPVATTNSKQQVIARGNNLASNPPSRKVRKGRSRFSKRFAQQLCIALNVIISVLCLACGLRVYTSSSFDEDVWSEGAQLHLNATCDVSN